MTINLDDATKAHVDWKTKFRVAIHKQDTMDAATIAKDNCCELGKWLHGEAKTRHSEVAAYPVLVTRHAAFHVEAGKIAALVNAKKFAEAELALQGDTPYGKASQSVGQAILQMRKETGL